MKKLKLKKKRHVLIALLIFTLLAGIFLAVTALGNSSGTMLGNTVTKKDGGGNQRSWRTRVPWTATETTGDTTRFEIGSFELTQVTNGSMGISSNTTITGTLENLNQPTKTWIKPNTVSGTFQIYQAPAPENDMHTHALVQTKPENLYWDFERACEDRTETIKATIVVSGGTSAWKGTSTATINITIPARDKYQVTYDANGGQNAPSVNEGTCQCGEVNSGKSYGYAFTLSSQEPIREGFVFAGWGTSPEGPVQYQPGGSYEENEDVTLYAIWDKNVAVTFSTPESLGTLPVVLSIDGEEVETINVEVADGATYTFSERYFVKEQGETRDIQIIPPAPDGYAVNVTGDAYSGFLVEYTSLTENYYHPWFVL